MDQIQTPTLPFLLDDLKRSLALNPTDNGQDAYPEQSHEIILGYLLYGAKVIAYDRQLAFNGSTDYGSPPLHLLGDRVFNKNSPIIAIGQFSPGHYDMLVPEDDIQLRKYAAHREYYSMLSQLISQTLGQPLNHTMIDEWMTNMILPIATNKISFSRHKMNRVCEIIRRANENYLEQHEIIDIQEELATAIMDMSQED